MSMIDFQGALVLSWFSVAISYPEKERSGLCETVVALVERGFVFF
jgi:hypothetical protein